MKRPIRWLLAGLVALGAYLAHAGTPYFAGNTLNSDNATIGNASVGFIDAGVFNIQFLDAGIVSGDVLIARGNPSAKANLIGIANTGSTSRVICWQSMNHAADTCAAGLSYSPATTNWVFTQGSVIGKVTSVAVNMTQFSADVGSGSNAFAVTTNGARIDFGSGATDHATSNGTTVTFAGGLTAGAAITSGASGNISAGTGADFILTSGRKLTVTSSITSTSATGVTPVYTAVASAPVYASTTVTYQQMAAAATRDVSIWTLNAKTRVIRVVAYVTQTFTGGALTDVDVTCGITAGGAEYLNSFDVDTATGFYGGKAAEIGANLTAATLDDIPSMSGTTLVQCRFTCAGANCNAATQGSILFSIEGTVYL